MDSGVVQTLLLGGKVLAQGLRRGQLVTPVARPYDAVGVVYKKAGHRVHPGRQQPLTQQLVTYQIFEGQGLRQLPYSGREASMMHANL